MGLIIKLKDMCMGLLDKAAPKSSKPAVNLNSSLSVQEYELLFTLIKSSTFKGEHLELLYNLIIKLQEQYLAAKNSNE